jgi:hypothetical protein
MCRKLSHISYYLHSSVITTKNSTVLPSNYLKVHDHLGIKLVTIMTEMKKLRTLLSLFLVLLCVSAEANNASIERLASEIQEAQLLVETRSFLRELNEQHKKGRTIDKDEALAVAAKLEEIASDGCECEDHEQEKMLGSQAYALAAGIYGILSKDKKDIFLARKSYLGLIKSRELFPDNTDAIKGQAVALNMILDRGWGAGQLAALALGINLKEAQKELIDDLREFPERKDLLRLADQLEDKL